MKRIVRQALARFWRVSRRTPVGRMLERSVTQDLLHPLLTKGHISVREARALSNEIRLLQTPGPIIEVGTLFGFSTMVIAVAKDADRPLITVDNFEWNPLGLSADNQIALARSFLMDSINNCNVTIVREDKDKFLNNYKGQTPSLIFLDANHTYQETLKDIRGALRLGPKVICGHDYSPLWPGVMKAVDECGGVRLVDESFWVLAGD